MKINGGDCITLAPLCRKTTKRYFSSKRKMIYCELKSNYIRMVMASFDLKMVWTSTCALSKSLNCWQIWLQIDWKRSIYYINSLANSIINIKCHLLKREHSLITNTAIASLEFIYTLIHLLYVYSRENFLSPIVGYICVIFLFRVIFALSQHHVPISKVLTTCELQNR